MSVIYKALSVVTGGTRMPFYLNRPSFFGLFQDDELGQVAVRPATDDFSYGFTESLQGGEGFGFHPGRFR